MIIILIEVVHAVLLKEVSNAFVINVSISVDMIIVINNLLPILN